MGGKGRLAVEIHTPRFSPWKDVYQQTQRWIRAGVFEEMVNDLLRVILRLSKERASEPSAVVLG